MQAPTSRPHLPLLRYNKSEIYKRVSVWEKLGRALSHAFALPARSAPLTAEDRALLEHIAQRLAQRRLEAPAVLFLESVGPLNFIGSQVLHGLRPFLELVCDATELERLAVLLERRDSLEQLSALLSHRA